MTSTEVVIKINKLDMVAHWDYPETKITNNMCNICKRNIMASSYENMALRNYTTKISIGKCKHTFHTNCINTTLKQNNSSLCPICITPWNFDKEYDTSSYHQIDSKK